MVLIEYNRYRFVEPETGLRIALDMHIRSYLVSPSNSLLTPRSRLNGAILETKGPHTQVPIQLSWLRHLGFDWTRYSKYAACLESHMTVPGAIGRSTPPGRIDSD